MILKYFPIAFRIGTMLPNLYTIKLPDREITTRDIDNAIFSLFYFCKITAWSASNIPKNFLLIRQGINENDKPKIISSAIMMIIHLGHTILCGYDTYLKICFTAEILSSYTKERQTSFSPVMLTQSRNLGGFY
jgi:hypothetical protein